MDVNLSLTETEHNLMKFFPPLIIVVPLIVLYNVLAFYLFCNKLDRQSARKAPAFTTGIVKILFQGALTSKRTGPSLLDKEYLLFGYPAPAGLVNSLGLFAIILLITTTTAFFDVFLKLTCHDGPFSEAHSKQIKRQCFGSFSYIQSAGAVGGTLILITIVLNIKMTITMWVIKNKNRASNQKTKRAWICLFVLSETAIGFIVVIVSVGFSSIQLVSRDGYYEFLQELLYDITVLQGSYFSLLVAYYNWNYGTKGPRGDVETGIEMLPTNNQQSPRSGDQVTFGTAYQLINDTMWDETTT